MPRPRRSGRATGDRTAFLTKDQICRKGQKYWDVPTRDNQSAGRDAPRSFLSLRFFFFLFSAPHPTPRPRRPSVWPGPKHWGKLRPLLPDGVPVGQLMQQHWHCWRICHGWLRFSGLTGELQVSKGNLTSAWHDIGVYAAAWRLPLPAFLARF